MEYSALLAGKGIDRIQNLTEVIKSNQPNLYALGSGCLVWRTNEQKVLLYDPCNVTVEVFYGEGCTQNYLDRRHIHRIVVDSETSKAQYKRAHRSPYYNVAYSIQWHGTTEHIEVAFPLFIDDKCVIIYIQKGRLIIPDGGSAVPQLEETSNIQDLLFFNSEPYKSEINPIIDKDLRNFLSESVPEDSLSQIIGRMSAAFDLRKASGPEKPFVRHKLFHFKD